MKNKIKAKFTGFIVWLLIGGILASAAGTMVIVGKVNLDNFYDVGEICNVYSYLLQSQQNTLVYADQTDDFLTVSSDAASMSILAYQEKWNYMVVNLSEMNTDSMSWILCFYDESGKMIGSQAVKVHSGENIIELSGTAYKSMLVQINNQTATEFRIDSMQLREQYPCWNWGKFWQVGIFVFLLYTVLVSIGRIIFVKKRIRLNIFSIVDGYQSILKKITSRLYLYVAEISAKKRHGIRITAFLIWFFYMTVAFNTGTLASNYKWNTAVSCSVLLIFTLMSLEKKPAKINWNKKYVLVWMVLMFCMCVSDFLVQKRCGYMGYIFLVFFGLFFFSISCMKRPADVLDDLIAAMQITFVVSTVFCLVSRPITERYIGFYINTNVFATYLMTMLVICMVSLEICMKKNWSKRRITLLVIEFVAILYFWWLTQSRGVLIAMLVVAAVFLIRTIHAGYDMVIRKRIQVTILLGVLLLLPVAGGIHWSLEKLPYRLNTVWQFEKDTELFASTNRIADGATLEVNAAQSRLTSTLKNFKSLDGLSSGRITFWKAYTYKLNLFGHYFREKIYGGIHYAHNGFLVMMYQYGVFTLVPYTVLWLWVLYRSAIMMKMNGKPYGFLLFGLYSTYFISAQLDVQEQPWAYPAWMLAYMLMGFLFMEKQQEQIESPRLSDDCNEKL